MKIRTLKWFFGFDAFTIYPYSFFVGKPDSFLVKHEFIHSEQQKRWFKKAWYFGTFAWLFCYMFFLPIGWNPFRYKWEYEAFTVGSMYSPSWTKAILRKNYFLWFN